MTTEDLHWKRISLVALVGTVGALLTGPLGGVSMLFPISVLVGVAIGLQCGRYDEEMIEAGLGGVLTGVGFFLVAMVIFLVEGLPIRPGYGDFTFITGVYTAAMILAFVPILGVVAAAGGVFTVRVRSRLESSV